MEEEIRGNYKMFFSNGVTAVMGDLTPTQAITKAREKAKEDPKLTLVQITPDIGGVTIRYQKKSMKEIVLLLRNLMGRFIGSNLHFRLSVALSVPNKKGLEVSNRK